MKNEKLFLLLGILVLFSLTSLSALSYNINSDVNIKTSCLNVNCSEEVNITIEYPNSSLAVDNEEMTLGSGYMNYTFSDTSTTGTYTYYTNNGYTNTFTIGEELTTGRAIGYIGFLIILLFTFFLTLYGAKKIEWKHKKSDEGKILTINNFRYLKVTLFALAYFELMFLFGLSYKIFNEANIDGFPQFFNLVYQIQLNLIFPLIIFLIIVVFVIWINNKKLQDKIKLGI